MPNVFMQAAANEIAIASDKEDQISLHRKELNPEINKVMTIANLAVVAKGLGLDAPLKTKGRKAAAGQFREMLLATGQKEAKVKLLAENAIKMTRHEAFAEIVAVAAKSNDVGAFSQSVQGEFDALKIKTQSKLVALLSPKVEVSAVDKFAIAALKECGADKSEIDKGKKKSDPICTKTATDADAVQLLLDAAARIDPRVKDVAATLVDAINNGGFEIEVQEAA